MTLDAYHWTGPTPEAVVDDELVLDDDGFPFDAEEDEGPMRIPLVEHYGPGPHKSGSPQSSHALGGTGRATAATMAGIEQGGSSVRTSGMTPSSGIMVSYPPGSGHNRVIDATAPRAKVEAQVREFVEAQRAFVTNKADRYIGGWVDAGKLHLDVSQNFPSSRRDAAIRAGRERNQIAVFSLDTFTDIPTGGAGV